MNGSSSMPVETGAELDEVVVRVDEYGVLICPDGREPVESLTCPTLPECQDNLLHKFRPQNETMHVSTGDVR